MNIKKTCIAFIVSFILIDSLYAKTVSVSSPDGKVVVEVNSDSSALTYTLSYKGQPLVQPSKISLLATETFEFVSAESSEQDSTWEPTWGSYSEIRDHCNQLTLNLKISGLPTSLICRVYDDGVGFRFAAPADNQWLGKALDFSLESKLEGEFDTYYTQGERDPAGPIPLQRLVAKTKKYKMPLVLESSEGTWLALLESDLYTARSFKQVASIITDEENSTIALAGGGQANGEAFVTPWRVILVGDSPGDLLNSTVALNLAAPCEIEDTSWLQTGTGLWDWRVHGYDNGEFAYGIDTRSYLRFIDFAAKHGIEYFTIDDHWYKGGESGQLVTNPAVDIEQVMAYAEEKGVKIILYFDRKRNKGKLILDSDLFDYYSSLGAAGIKYGFQGANVEFTRPSIEGADDEKMFIFYHDDPAAMIGVERTMPNLFTREFCHAQQDARKAFSPTGFLG